MTLIAECRLYLVEIPYKVAYETATNTTPKGRHIVLRLQTDDNTVGWGETGIISRRYPSQGDSPETIFVALDKYLCPAIIGKSPLSPNVIMTNLDRLIQGHLFAKAAVDHALLDLQGKLLNQSVSTLLGGQFRTKYAVSRSLPLAAPSVVANRAADLRDAGYSRLTLKGGGNLINDRDAFIATRKVVGSDYELEVDPNGAYTANNAVQFIKSIEDYGIFAMEQPTPGPDIAALAYVKGRVSTPIIADESIFDERDLRDIIRLDAADVICLKPFKSGGILASKRLQHTAEGMGLQISTGSMHPFGIGTAALHHFASSLNNVVTTGYGAPTERFMDDILDDSCFTFRDGEVTISAERPGLGVVVNEKKVQNYSSQTSVISVTDMTR